MRIIRTSATYNPKENWGEVNSKPSETIPDQTIPLRALLENYTRGALPVGQKPYWDASEELDIRTMDLVDLQELGMSARHSIDEFRAQQVQRQKEKDALLSRYTKFGKIEDLEAFEENFEE